MKPELHTETRTRIICPGCGAKDQFSWGHLTDFIGTDRSWGPWSCDHCGTSIKGTVMADGSPDIEVLDEKHTPGWLLVKVSGSSPLVFLVFDHPLYSWNADDPDGHTRYWVEQHTCPTNILRSEAVLWEGDADPHGVLEFVEHVAKPADWPDQPCYDDWAGLFTRLPGAIIDAAAAPANDEPARIPYFGLRVPAGTVIRHILMSADAQASLATVLLMDNRVAPVINAVVLAEYAFEVEQGDEVNCTSDGVRAAWLVNGEEKFAANLADYYGDRP